MRVLPFCRSAVLPFCRSAVLPFCRSAASRLTAAGFVLMLAARANAQPEPNYAREQEIAQMGEITPNVSADFDPVLGTPTFIRSTTAFLTRRSTRTAAQVVADFVNVHPATYGVSLAGGSLAGTPEYSEASFRVLRDYETPSVGIHHLTYQQQHNGQDIYGCLLTANVTTDGMLLNIGCSFLPDPPGVITPPGCGARDAVAAACDAVQDSRIMDIVNLISTEADCDTEWPVGHTYTGVGESALYVRSIIYPLSRTQLVQAWLVSLPSDPTADDAAWECVVLQSDLSVATQYDVTTHSCDPEDAYFRAYRGDSPVPGTPGLTTLPSETDSECVQRALLPDVDDCGHPINDTRELLVVVAAGASVASPNGWLNEGVWYDATDQNHTNPHIGYSSCASYHNGVAAQTCGNNVRVVWVQNSIETTVVASGRTFDTNAILLPQPAVGVAEAGVINAFVAVNEWHDLMMTLGFDESAGNYQSYNFSGKGVGGDPLLVRINSGTNQYGTTDTGGAIREDGLGWATINLHRMTLDAPLDDIAAALDRTVIFHELTHAMEARLVVGTAAVGNHAGGISEGWADFFAVALTAQSTDSFDATFPVFSYAARKIATDPNQYYFGARSYPYSTDMDVDPLTFGFLRASSSSCQPVHSFPEPRNPNQSIDPANPTERLNKYRIAEVWASALLDCRARVAVIDGARANDILIQLVVDSMKLVPPKPNLLQGRDALLQADLARFGGVHQQAIWQAFANRGLGIYATSPPGGATLITNPSAAELCEDFTMPAANVVSVFYPDDLPVSIATCEETTLEVNAVCPNGIISSVIAWAASNGCAIGLDSEMTLLSPGHYRSTLRAGACRQSWTVWIETTAGLTTQQWPSFPILAGDTDQWTQTFESNTGWSGTSTGAGRWEWVDPTGGPIHPSRDATPDGTKCYVTENHNSGTPSTVLDADDVDSTSPGVVLDSSEVPTIAGTSAIVEFSMWYASVGGNANDEEVSIDWIHTTGGTEQAYHLITYTPADSALRWQRRRLLIDDTHADPGSTVHVRFRFVDPAPASVVEGGIDDLRVTWVSECECCDGDYNRDGNNDQLDVSYLVDLIGGAPNITCSDPDFNHDGNADQDDVGSLINYVGGGGCP